MTTRPREGRGIARRLVAVLIITLAIGSLLVAGPLPEADAAPAPMALVATPTSTSAVRLTWQPPPGFDAGSWVVYPTDEDGRAWGSTSVCADCTSTVIDGLTANTSFSFSVVGYSASGLALGQASARTLAGLCAGVSGTCVDVGRTGGTPPTHAAQGFLYGLTPRTDINSLRSLKPTGWRFAINDTFRFTKARDLGGAITLVLSDGWRGWADSHNLVGANPWTDLNVYSTFVTQSVQRQISLGQLPEYWDVQNEPELVGTYKTADPVTRDNVLQQMKVAHDAIRALLPDAHIVGPSLSQFRYDEPAAAADLKSFVQFAAANGLHFDLSWHENGNSTPNSMKGDPRIIVAHVESVRQLIADNPGIGPAQILVNEYGAPWTFDQPGAAVGYVTALETAKVNGAHRACWPVTVNERLYDSCFSDPGLLDGLLTSTGLKSDTYWVADAYASMIGKRLPSETTDPWTSVLSTVEANSSIRALVGRHESCTVGIDEGCHAGIAAAGPGAPVTIVLGPLCTKVNYDVKVDLIVDLPNVVSAPVTVFNNRVKCSLTGTRVALPPLADGAVYNLTATPR